MKISHKIALILAGLFAFWLASGVLFPHDKKKSVVADKPLLKVQATELTAQEKSPEIIVYGYTEADRKVDLIAETDGRVLKVFVSDGQMVQAGEEIMRIDPRDSYSKLEEARAKVKSRDLQLKASSELTQQGYKSPLALALDKANQEEAEAQLSGAKWTYGRTRLKAPFAGRIDKITVKEGDYAGIRFGGGGGFGTPALATLLDLDPITVVGFVSEIERMKLQIGQGASLKLANGDILEGRVRFISSIANPQTRAFRVEVEAQNPDYKVRDGQSVQLTLQAEAVQAYMLSPSVLSLNDKGQIGVKLLDEQNRTKFQPVEIIADSVSGIWVSGLPGKIKVITQGQAMAAEGEVVSTNEAL